MTSTDSIGSPEQSQHWPQRVSWWAAALLAVSTLVLVVVPSVWSGRLGVNNFQDDAFYYIVPAKSFVAHGQFTFDGQTATNGFHPLWMAFVVGTVALIGIDASPEVYVFAINLLENILRCGAVLLCLFLAWRADAPLRLGFLAILPLLLYPGYVIFQQGMETTLAALLFILCLHFVVADKPFALGITLALLCLTRLDTGVFVALPLGTWALVRSQGAWSQRRWALLPVIAVLGAVTIVNLVTTGHSVPISGAIKSSFPHITWHGSYFVEPFNIVALYGWGTFLHINLPLTGGVLALGFLATMLGPLRGRLREAVLVVGLVGALLLANLLLFQSWEKSHDPRYFALPMTAAAFVLGVGVSSLAEGWRTRAQASRMWSRVGPLVSLVPAAVLVTLLTVQFGRAAREFEAGFARTDNRIRSIYKAVADAVPADAVMAGTDVGALAFWTGRRTVNLDGVMNDFTYQQRLRDGQFGQYLREQGVTHLANGLIDTLQTYTGRPTEPMYRHTVDALATHGEPYGCHHYYVYSYVYSRYSDPVCLRREDEVYRTEVDPPGLGKGAYVVWRLPRSG